MPRMTKARRRGLYPEYGPIERFEKEVEVTLSLPVGLYKWLTEFVGINSFAFCVEQTIHTALRCMRGSEGGMNLDALADVVASQRRTTRIEAVFGEIKDPEHRRAAGLLYGAAMFAAFGARADDLCEGFPKDRQGDRKAILDALRTVYPERDFEAEMEAWREEEKREQAEIERYYAELEANAPTKRRCDLDDDIPF